MVVMYVCMFVVECYRERGNGEILSEREGWGSWARGKQEERGSENGWWKEAREGRDVVGAWLLLALVDAQCSTRSFSEPTAKHRWYAHDALCPSG